MVHTELEEFAIHDVAGTSRGDGSHPFTPGGGLRGCFILPAEHWLHKGAAAALGQSTGGPNKLTMTASSRMFCRNFIFRTI